jgi:hypothetical protein
MAAHGTQDDNFDDDLDENDDRVYNLTDDDLQSEIELVSELVVAATSSDGPLHQDAVDQILGVELKAPRPAAPSG